MSDIDITRLIRHRLLAELHKVTAELLLERDYAGLQRLLELSDRYRKLLQDAF